LLKYHMLKGGWFGLGDFHFGILSFLSPNIDFPGVSVTAQLIKDVFTHFVTNTQCSHIIYKNKTNGVPKEQTNLIL